MIKIKYLFILVLCLATLGTAANVTAQSNVLVSAGGKSLKQSDIDGLIDFYEWALGAKFTGRQREEYRKIKVEEFRHDPEHSTKGNTELVGYLPQIRAKSKSEQTKMRDAFNADFIPNLRKAT